MIRSAATRRRPTPTWPTWPVLAAAARDHWAVMLLMLVCTCVGALPRTAVAQGLNREYPLKAAYIYKFGSYVEWPANTFADAESPFVIGIVGRSRVEVPLQQIAAANRIGGRPIKIVQYGSVDEIQPCQMLFVSGTLPREQQLAAIQRAQGMSVLTIGESSQFAADGGGVRFFVENNKLRFEINVNATRQHNLKVSSQLLGLAKVIGAAAPK